MSLPCLPLLREAASLYRAGSSTLQTFAQLVTSHDKDTSQTQSGVPGDPRGAPVTRCGGCGWSWSCADPRERGRTGPGELGAGARLRQVPPHLYVPASERCGLAPRRASSGAAGCRVEDHVKQNKHREETAGPSTKQTCTPAAGSRCGVHTELGTSRKEKHQSLPEKEASPQLRPPVLHMENPQARPLLSWLLLRHLRTVMMIVHSYMFG